MSEGAATRSAGRTGAMLGAGVLAAAAVAVVARVHPATAVASAAGFSGLLAVLTGAVVLVDTPGRHDGMRTSARLFGIGMTTWGIGQLILGWEAFVGHPAFPTLGDVLGTISAPFAIAGVLLALRPSSVRTHWVRMLLDSLLLAAAAGLMLWRVAFRAVLSDGGVTRGDLLAVAIVLIEVSIIAMVGLAWLRDLDRGLLLMLLGFGLYAAADQYTLSSVVNGRMWPWGAAALWCVAWPVIGEGILRLRPTPHDDAEHPSEARVTFTTTIVSLVVLLVAVAAFSADPVTDGVTVALAIAIIAVFAARETYTGLQRARLLRSLTHQALRDPLTGLGNRRAMSGVLGRTHYAASGAVLTLDLDGFKEVNDVLGHARGDALLEAVARRVEWALDADCAAFRVGGDEFVVLVPGPPGRDRELAQTLLEDVRGAAEALPGAVAVGVSASIGIARWSGRVDAAVVESGVALHAAKQSGRDRVESYDGPVAAAHRRATDLERRLKFAVAAGHIDVQYQPVLRLRDDEVVGFEALARWVDPVLGRVGPDEFIPAAERCGLISALGEHVMRRALGDLVELSRTVPGARMAVNVSPVQLRSQSFAADVLAVLAELGLEPGRLVVEVTESAFLGEEAAELGQLRELRRHGAWVAIDDFGSGYSALAYLSRLPASTLKLDQGLTANLSSDPRALAVMRSIIDLGRALPLEIVVEGIETTEVRDVVRDLGAQYAQGWLYSPAVPLEDVAAVVEQVYQARAASALTRGSGTDL